MALNDELDNLPDAELLELKALHHLSDNALRAIAAEEMSAENLKLMARLIRRNNLGELTKEERECLEQFVERGERFMLRRGEAAAILANRNGK